MRVFKSFCREKEKEKKTFYSYFGQRRNEAETYFILRIHTLFFLFVGHSFPFGAISEKTLCRENTIVLYTRMQDYSANRKSALGNFRES